MNTVVRHSPNYKDRTGERGIANNGMGMCIFRYRTAMDLDVQFDDGTIVEHITYNSFKLGTVKNPNYLNYRQPEQGRIGETSLSKDGILLTITKYNNCADMEVTAASGEVFTHQNYTRFINHKISVHSVADTRVGEQQRSNKGQTMTIIAYRGIYDIDVQFEDGTVVTHKTYKNFKKGMIANPNYRLTNEKYLGMSKKMKCGMTATITAVRAYRDADVVFENGAVLEHVAIGNFLRGGITPPNYRANIYLGKKHQATNGQMMTIIEYHSCADLVVQFEDGTRVDHIRYENFKLGKVKNPNYTYTQALAEERTNQIVYTTVGLCATLVKVSSITSGEIAFDTGYTAPMKSYQNFKSGRIGHPFPYTVGNVVMEKPAYKLGSVGNFYCHCIKCGMKDIMSVAEIKSHKCIEN